MRREHTLQVFARFLHFRSEAFESDGRVDQVPQYRLTGLHVAGEVSVHGLDQERLTEQSVATEARRHALSEIPGQCRHGSAARRNVGVYAALRPFAEGVK